MESPPPPGHFSVVITFVKHPDKRAVNDFIENLKRLPGVAYDVNSLEIRSTFWGRKRIRVNRLQRSLREADELKSSIDRRIAALGLEENVRLRWFLSSIEGQLGD